MKVCAGRLSPGQFTQLEIRLTFVFLNERHMFNNLFLAQEKVIMVVQMMSRVATTVALLLQNVRTRTN